MKEHERASMALRGVQDDLHGDREATVDLSLSLSALSPLLKDSSARLPADRASIAEANNKMGPVLSRPGSSEIEVGLSAPGTCLRVIGEGEEDPWAAVDEDEDAFLLPGDPLPLMRQRREEAREDIRRVADREMMLDVGRLRPEDVQKLCPLRPGGGSSALFAVLAACHLARTRQRAYAPVPSGGFVAWALQNLRDEEEGSAGKQEIFVSLRGAVQVVSSFGASHSYGDSTGVANVNLGHLEEADRYPQVKVGSVARTRHAFRQALEAGDAVCCVWRHSGTSRAVLSDHTVVRRVSLVCAPGVEDPVDLVAGCMVGHDPDTDLFFGYSPTVTSAIADPGTPVAFSSVFLSTSRMVEAVRVRLQERTSSAMSDLNTEQSATLPADSTSTDDDQEDDSSM